jgi:2-polyprenyl-3-methyl-5-hydroxy-6-metoxy-1,4-benzoquinol methylase
VAQDFRVMAPRQKIRGDSGFVGALERLRDASDRITKRQLTRLRDAGDRLTGGGLRGLVNPVVTKLLRSPINRPVDSLLVNSLYKTAFGRLADEAGLAGNLVRLRSGGPLQLLAEELVASAEFQSRHGSTQKIDADYLKALYRDGLGREPDPDGLAQWLAEGEKGTTRAKVLAAFAGSDEVIRSVATLLVNSLYRTAFGRLADEDGLATYLKQLQSGVSLEALAEELVASPEFAVRHGLSQKIDGEYLTALYRDGFGRQPDLEELVHWLVEGEKGATRAKVLAALADLTNRPYTGDPSLLVKALHKAAFGRLPEPGDLANGARQLRSGVSPQALAEELVASAEFQSRHGSTQKIDADYLKALYRDGLGREPDPDGLAQWLAEGEKGATRANVLAAFAGSNEAIAAASIPHVVNLHRYVTEVLPRELCERMDAQLMLYTQESQRQISAALKVAEIENAAPTPLLTEQEYVCLQNRFRGSADVLQDRMKPYVEMLAGRSNVLDVGCGDGTLLCALGEGGIRSEGIELNAIQVNRCQERGLRVQHADVFEFLDQSKIGTYDAICALHLIEHFSTHKLREFLARSYNALRSGGLLVIEFPSVKSLAAFAWYYPIDPTHQMPKSPDLVSFLVELAGFKDVKTVYRNSVDYPTNFSTDVGSENGWNVVRKNFAILNEYMFGGADACIIGTR